MNRLQNSTSTYLREHSEQPVHWWPYGPAAFAHARERDVPVLISIGYSACHWCHVMSAESFSDPETAAYLNEHFVCIKVDRLEHPHVDAAYISVVQAMTGRAGWPLNAFTDADGLAFYAGLYYPREPRGGQPSLRQVCDAVLDAWSQRREQALASGRMVVAMLGQDFTTTSRATREERAPTEAALIHALLRDHDPEHGGSGRDAKFPELYLVQAQLGAWLRARDHADSPQASALLRAISSRISAIGRGALSDPVAGGIFRYTVDRQWSTPHFEKMLSDNAQWLETLAALLRADACGVTPRDVAEAARGLQSSLGRSPQPLHGDGFFTARSADSRPDPAVARQGYLEREGAHYVWNAPLVAAALATDPATAASALEASGLIVPAAEPGPLTRRAPAPPRLLPEPLPEGLRDPLASAANGRPAPAPDHLLTLETQAAAWASCADALAVGGLPGIEPDALVAGFQRCLGPWRLGPGRYAHALFEGQASQVPATLADLGALGWADWRIAQATGGEPLWLEDIARVLREAAAESGTLQEPAWDPAQGPLPAGAPLATVVTESAAPSGVAWGLRALAAHILWGVGRADLTAATEADPLEVTGERAARASAAVVRATLARHAPLLHAAPEAAPALTIEWLRDRARREDGILVVHVTPGEGAAALWSAALLSPQPNLVLVRESTTYPAGATALAYVCTTRDDTGWCSPPVATAGALAAALRGDAAAAPQG